MLQSRILNVANISFNAFRENKIIAKNSEFTVTTTSTLHSWIIYMSLVFLLSLLIQWLSNSLDNTSLLFIIEFPCFRLQRIMDNFFVLSDLVAFA